jgi:hypothetical protein
VNRIEKLNLDLQLSQSDTASQAKVGNENDLELRLSPSSPEHKGELVVLSQTLKLSLSKISLELDEDGSPSLIMKSSPLDEFPSLNSMLGGRKEEEPSYPRLQPKAGSASAEEDSRYLSKYIVPTTSNKRKRDEELDEDLSRNEAEIVGIGPPSKLPRIRMGPASLNVGDNDRALVSPMKSIESVDSVIFQIFDCEMNQMETDLEEKITALRSQLQHDVVLLFRQVFEFRPLT